MENISAFSLRDLVCMALGGADRCIMKLKTLVKTALTVF